MRSLKAFGYGAALGFLLLSQGCGGAQGAHDHDVSHGDLCRAALHTCDVVCDRLIERVCSSNDGDLCTAAQTTCAVVCEHFVEQQCPTQTGNAGEQEPNQ